MTRLHEEFPAVALSSHCTDPEKMRFYPAIEAALSETRTCRVDFRGMGMRSAAIFSGIGRRFLAEVVPRARNLVGGDGACGNRLCRCAAAFAVADRPRGGRLDSGGALAIAGRRGRARPIDRGWAWSSIATPWPVITPSNFAAAERFQLFRQGMTPHLPRRPGSFPKAREAEKLRWGGRSCRPSTGRPRIRLQPSLLAALVDLSMDGKTAHPIGFSLR